MAREATKPTCTLEDLQGLGSLPIKIGDQIIGYVSAKQFSSGSFGLSFTGKNHFPFAEGKVAYFQCSANFTVIGSKPKEKKDEVPEEQAA